MNNDEWMEQQQAYQQEMLGYARQRAAAITESCRPCPLHRPQAGPGLLPDVRKKELDMLKRFLMIGAVAASISVGGCVDMGAASADPAVCGGPGTPPCAPPLSAEQQCALIAWRTWTPCNWLGAQVPVGTPGSVG